MTKDELFSAYPKEVLERFKAFHGKNPHIYSRFCHLTFQMRKAGRLCYSARTIMEVMRWEVDLKTTGNSFKINDDFIPIYARLLIYHYPEYVDFFELRVVRSKGRKSQEELEREAML